MIAILKNDDHPEYGEVSIPLPIKDSEYGHCMDLLSSLGIGGALSKDCQVEELTRAYPTLRCLEGCKINIDELDYLAKRLDGFDAVEISQFQAMADKLKLTDMKDLINLTVLSAEGVRARIMALTNLLRAEPAVELMALDSRESFQPNKAYYQARLDKETVPALRNLLQQDLKHLDEIQSASASAREFLLILRPEGKAIPDEAGLRQMEKALCDHGISVHLAEEQDVKRLLAVYYQHDVTTDFFEDADGERMVNKDA